MQKQKNKIAAKTFGRFIYLPYICHNQITKTMKNLAQLKNRRFELETTMVNTFTQQKARNREMFEISKEIEKLENPNAYAENKNHWENHEVRF